MNKTMEEQISGFLRNAQENIKAAYDKGYKNGLNDRNINDETFASIVKEAYDNGLNDAWECARRIYEMPCDVVCELFPDSNDVIFADITASEAIEKIREYDERKRQEELKKVCDDKIHIGDEVYILDKNHRSIVTALLDSGNKVNLLCASGNYSVVETRKLHKTGNVYTISELLKSLSEEQRND